MHAVFQLKHGLSLILASTSPRRKQLLEMLGLPFSIVSIDEEEPLPDAQETPQEFSQRAALFKGQCCLRTFTSVENIIILAADTIVCIDGQILGKPREEEEALQMLCQLNGRSHEVYTSYYLGLPLTAGYKEICGAERSLVSFGEWPHAVLRAYAHSSEPLDKAGSYAVQGRGAFLIKSIEGSWTNVMGLPLEKITEILLEHNLVHPRRV